MPPQNHDLDYDASNAMFATMRIPDDLSVTTSPFLKYGRIVKQMRQHATKRRSTGLTLPAETEHCGGMSQASTASECSLPLIVTHNTLKHPA